VVTAERRVRCAGSNDFGQLGDGSLEAAAVLVEGADAKVSDVIDLAVGPRHACARVASGKVLCWGDDREGAVSGERDPGCSSSLVLGTAKGPRRASSNGASVCTWDGVGGARCWGEASLFAQTGRDLVAEPTDLPASTGARDVALGSWSDLACVASASGAVACWKKGTAIGGAVLAGVADAVEVEAGSAHACARTASGAIFCWGDNERGQLGRAEPAESDDAVALALPGAAPAVALSCYEQTCCAALKTGAVACWGDNAGAIAAPGRDDAAVTAPTLVPGSVSWAATAVALAGDSACALTAGGVPWCWGKDGLPEAVDGATGFNTISVGRAHACGLRTKPGDVGLRVACWGSNVEGQLGIDWRTDPQVDLHRAAPVEPPPASWGNTAWAAVTAAGDVTCAISADEARCWGGLGALQCGLGSDRRVSLPHEVEVPQ
jgi:alpha-tubulin suppressor-like RCC1 family protein